jgi:hypothetical protein
LSQHIFTYPRGSEWRKWDLQIHTPASHLNNQFGSDWDAYVQGLFRAAIEKDIAVIGLTDYFTIDGYRKVKEDYLAKPEKLASLFEPNEIKKIAKIRVFPNVEFRLRTLVGPNRINCHVILSDEVSSSDIEEHFLHDLTFTNQAEPQTSAQTRKLKTDNLRTFGARLIDEHPLFADDGDALFVGMKNAVVDDNEVVKLLSQDERFKDKYFFCVVPDEDLSKISWNCQDHHVRKTLIQRSDALFAGNPATMRSAIRVLSAERALIPVPNIHPNANCDSAGSKQTQHLRVCDKLCMSLRTGCISDLQHPITMTKRALFHRCVYLAVKDGLMTVIFNSTPVWFQSSDKKVLESLLWPI